MNTTWAEVSGQLSSAPFNEEGVGPQKQLQTSQTCIEKKNINGVVPQYYSTLKSWIVDQLRVLFERFRTGCWCSEVRSRSGVGPELRARPGCPPCKKANFLVWVAMKCCSRTTTPTPISCAYEAASAGVRIRVTSVSSRAGVSGIGYRFPLLGWPPGVAR
jgi:hypothetical protein